MTNILNILICDYMLFSITNHADKYNLDNLK